MYFEDLEIDDNIFVEVDVPDDPGAIGYDLHSIMIGEVTIRVERSIKDGFRHIGYKLEVVGESDDKLDNLIATAIESQEKGRQSDRIEQGYEQVKDRRMFPPLHEANFKGE